MVQLPGMTQGQGQPQGQPQMPPPQMPPPQGQVTPEQSNVGGDMNKLLEVLGMAIQQSVDEQGYVDVQQLVQIWPQMAAQGGINIPFQTVMQLIQSNPQLISDLIVRYGLSGISMNGQRISAEQLAGLGSGAVGGRRM